ncbi:MAG: ABC transporter permease [Thermomicrobiales bacterium]
MAVARRFPRPFRRTDADTIVPTADDVIEIASPRKLMWLKFRRHKLAMIGMASIVLLYTLAIFNGFFAPTTPDERSSYPYAAPTRIHFFDDGKFSPFVYGLTKKTIPGTMNRSIETDRSTKIPVNFFVRGSEYSILGIFTSDLHLFQAEEGGNVFLFGTDKLGRDLFTRILKGATISLSIGLVGVALSFFLGSILGGFSGYYGGAFDTVVQRLIEFVMSVPTIPLWLALSAVIPQTWSAIQVYFAITVILSLEGWTGMARVVRGKLLQLREEDFVLDAHLAGASDWRVVIVHMLPTFASYLIVQLTIAIPGMILGETALSFLGLGLRAPVVSWGVLLQDAQNVRSILSYPWLLIPGGFVAFTVMAFFFFGDGLRDAADPYKN